MLMTPMTPKVIARPIADQHQHRAEAQAEEQRLDAPSRSCATSRCCAPPRPRRACTSASALGEAAVRRRLEQRRQPVAHLRAEPVATASSTAASRAPRSPLSSAASARPVSISCLHRRRRFRRRPAARSSSRVALVERRASSPSPRRAAPPGPDSASAKRATVRSAGTAAGGCWCRSSSARRRRRRAGGLQRDADRSASAQAGCRRPTWR